MGEKASPIASEAHYPLTSHGLNLPYPIKDFVMQAKTVELQSCALDSMADIKRQSLKLSDLDSSALADVEAMFGLWKEADHCDKDIRD